MDFVIRGRRLFSQAAPAYFVFVMPRLDPSGRDSASIIPSYRQTGVSPYDRGSRAAR